ncbi:MAG: hypothetical protein GOV00_01130 [Candidatus Altiarchaeota archaeon]|nr:hypothetical protein [Candidatus Altiarchaeota archaeon]
MDKKLIFASVFLLTFHLIFTPIIGYDHARNLEVAREMANTGLMSYYGENFVSNPPLLYMVHALIIKLFGFHYILHRMVDLLFWIAAMFVLEALGKEVNVQHLGLLIGLSWTFVYATAIRSYSDTLLLSAIMLLLYFRFKKEPSLRGAMWFGISYGVAGWAKYPPFLLSAFFLLDWLVHKKPLKYIIIALVVGSSFALPLIAYAQFNGLPMPWTASVDTNVVWRTGDPQTLYEPYLLLLKMWPALFTLAFSSLRLDLFSAILVGVPLIGRVVSKVFEVRHYFFIIIAMGVLASRFIEKKTMALGCLLVCCMFSNFRPIRHLPLRF